MLLWIVWITAAVGMLFRVLWVGAPRWLTVPVYIAMGWTAMFFLPQIWRNGDNGPVVPALAEPTPTQRQAFNLIGIAIPLHLGR